MDQGAEGRREGQRLSTPVARGLPHPSVHFSARTDAGEWFDAETVARARAYARPVRRRRLIDSLAGGAVVLALLFGKAGPRTLRALDLHDYPLALLVALSEVILATTLVGLPFSWWRTLVWDRRWGLSTQTVTTWIRDQLTTIVLGVVIGTAVAVALFAVIRATSLWWLLGGLLLAGFGVLGGFLFPVLIAPRFNTFVPLPEGGLKDAIEKIAALSGVRIAGAFTMDASRRSTRDNAYVSGLGTTARVVMFDTILEHPQHLVEQVIAHELGHYRLRHVIRSVPELAVLSVVVFAVTDAVCSWSWLLHAAGVASLRDPGSLVLLLAVVGAAYGGLDVVAAWRSRTRERQADLEALEVLQDPGALIDTWRRMTPKNLADLEPSRWARLTASHPQPAERMAFARDWATLNRVPVVEPAPTP